MTLATDEFIRRFLIHVLPKGFHRIRHYGLFANGHRRETIARARALIDAAAPRAGGMVIAETGEAADATAEPAHRCPCCGGRMIIVETFAPGATPRRRPPPPIVVIRIDSS